ncbi:MAG TPA: RNA methyltransferase [Ruminococcaceae bacterium]|nr:RNA methyltransferase [Oscillospiraceae bacterium]
MERLTSRENALIKEYRKLSASRRHREETGCFVLEGARLVLDAAQSGIALRTLLISDEGERYPETEKLKGLVQRCFSIPKELAAYISDTEHPQGIFAVGEMPKAKPLTMEKGSYLLLDELQDPGNLGTILRTAEAMGVTAVVLSAHCPDLFSPKVIRSTMGSGWRQKTVRVENLAESIAAWQKQGLRCYAATLTPEALPLQKLPVGDCRGIVIGNEGNGVSREVIEVCDGEVYIPMRGAAESLNAAAAAALCMWELSGRGYLPG